MRIQITINDDDLIDLATSNGRLNAVRDYDVRSAYPSAIAEVAAEPKPSRRTVRKLAINSTYGKLARKRKPARRRKS